MRGGGNSWTSACVSLDVGEHVALPLLVWLWITSGFDTPNTIVSHFLGRRIDLVMGIVFAPKTPPHPR
jgi:hypothetical protein